MVFKNSLNSVKTPKKRARPEKTASNAASASVSSSKLGDSDLNGYLSQYISAEAAALSKQKNPMPPPTNLFGGFQVTPSANKNSPIETSNQTEDRTTNKTPSTALSSASVMNDIGKSTRETSDRLFSNKKFQLYGFEGEFSNY